MSSILDDFKVAFKTGNILNQLIVINVVVFLFLGVLNVMLTLAGQSAFYNEVLYFFTLPSSLGSLIYKPWTFITYAFTHEGVFHILWNMLFMYWFGRIITEYLGQNKLLGLYVWGGIGGGLLYLIAYNSLGYFESVAQVSTLLGASGAVTAIVVGAATFQPNFQINLILLGPVKLKYIAAFMVVTSFLQSAGSNAGGEIAHLGGALVGYFSMTQLQKGRDWSKPVVQFVTWVKSLFRPQPKIKVSYKKEQKATSRTKRASTSRASRASSRTNTATKETTSQDEIDAILDKISEKGYDALSKAEKQKLFNASKD